MKRLALVGAAAGILCSLALPAAQASTHPAGAKPLSSPLRFTIIQYNSPGSDHGDNVSLNAEWVTIYNPTSTPRPMSGFHVHDAGTIHRYTFKSFTLGPHKSVRLHTGKGRDTATNKYWGMGKGGYIWNNTGDTATLASAQGSVVDVCKWKDPSEKYNDVRC